MDESKIHELAKKVGGRFRLASLIQKRLLELNRGQRRLVDGEFGSPLYVVMSEIEGGKITLRPPEPEKAPDVSQIPSLETPSEES